MWCECPKSSIIGNKTQKKHKYEYKKFILHKTKYSAFTIYMYNNNIYMNDKNFGAGLTYFGAALTKFGAALTNNK